MAQLSAIVEELAATEKLTLIFASLETSDVLIIMPVLYDEELAKENP